MFVVLAEALFWVMERAGNIRITLTLTLMQHLPFSIDLLINCSCHGDVLMDRIQLVLMRLFKWTCELRWRLQVFIRCFRMIGWKEEKNKVSIFESGWNLHLLSLKSERTLIT